MTSSSPCCNREDARFAYKRTPEAVQTAADVQAAFKLLQHLWVKDYEGMWAALDYAWPDQVLGLAAALRGRLQGHRYDLVAKAYADISAPKLAALLGTSEAEARQGAEQRGWTEEEVDGARLLVPKPAPVPPPCAATEADLERLAEYVVFLQTGEGAPQAAA